MSKFFTGQAWAKHMKQREKERQMMNRAISKSKKNKIAPPPQTTQPAQSPPRPSPSAQVSTPTTAQPMDTSTIPNDDTATLTSSPPRGHATDPAPPPTPEGPKQATPLASTATPIDLTEDSDTEEHVHIKASVPLPSKSQHNFISSKDLTNIHLHCDFLKPISKQECTVMRNKMNDPEIYAYYNKLNPIDYNKENDMQLGIYMIQEYLDEVNQAAYSQNTSTYVFHVEQLNKVLYSSWPCSQEDVRTFIASSGNIIFGTYAELLNATPDKFEEIKTRISNIPEEKCSMKLSNCPNSLDAIPAHVTIWVDTPGMIPFGFPNVDGGVEQIVIDSNITRFRKCSTREGNLEF